ncbi:hypothetical protein [Paracoccus sp. SSK6]|uniref:hypothetical protein n=1 Tax=Paracoccus sp. SSK6 TaxID=3143131 RepID=UPI00321A2536
MTQATLTLDGFEPLQGTVETGGDYIRFRTGSPIDPAGLDRLRHGRITIDGKAEKVMVKSVQPHAGEDGTEGLELTLQRFAPSST